MFDLIEEAIVDMKDNEHIYLKSIVSELPRSCDSISDYVYLANVYLSIQERLYFKLKQIHRKDYNWLSDNVVKTCLNLLENVMGKECTEGADRGQVWTEETIIAPHMEDEHGRIDEALLTLLEGTELENTRFRFTAIVDLVTPSTVWEIKCTSSITIDHQLQVVIYAWLWGFSGRPPRVFRILNIKTGEQWVLQSTQGELEKIVIALLKGKYAKMAEKTDEEFLSSTRSKN
jgi:hypothetical protein